MTIREAVTVILDDSHGETFSLWGLTDRVGLAVGRRVLLRGPRAWAVPVCAGRQDSLGAFRLTAAPCCDTMLMLILTGGWIDGCHVCGDNMRTFCSGRECIHTLERRQRPG